MGVKYVKNFSFPASGGFHAPVQRFAKGGHVTKVPAKAKASTKGVPAKAKPNAPARDMKSGKAPPAKRRYAEGGDVAPTKMLRLPPPTVTPKQGATEEELARLRAQLEAYDSAIPENNFEGMPPGKGPAYGGDPMPPLEGGIYLPPPDEIVGPGPIESDRVVKETLLDPRNYAMPVESTPFLRPKFDLESQEQTNARLAADRGMRRQNRMDMVGGRGEMGRRRMPMSPLQAAAAAPRPPMESGDRFAPKPIPGIRPAAKRTPVAEPASMVNPREAQMYAKGGKVGMDNYAGKTGPYRGSPKKARELGRQDRRAREAMERAEKHAPGLALDMKAKGGMPVHRRKPMYGGGKC